MKKIFIAIMAVAAAVSCSQELTVDAPKGAAIAFDNAFVENSTRAAVDLTKGNFDFGVYGTVANASGNGLIFDNKEVAADGTYSPVQYWVANATYTFTAYAPYSNAKWAYKPAEGTSSEAYNGTLSFDNAAALGEQDLIFAAATRTTPATIESAEKVGLTFGHLLSKVAFKFTNIFTDENISLNVYGVKINNAAAKGTLPVVDGATEEWTGTGDYVRAFGAAEASAAAALANGASLTTEHYYLIPVERDYEITFNVGLYQAGVLLNTYEHKIKVTLNLEKGKSYSLNATLAAENVNPESQLFPIEFKVDGVEDWTEGNVTIVAEHEVATADKLVEAIAEGGSILLTQDINLDEVSSRANAYAGLTIDNDVVIDGAGHKLTSSATRAINIVGGHTVTIMNAEVVAGNTSADYYRAINVEGANNNVTLENVTAYAYYYTVNLVSSVDNCVLNINNCNITGITAINVWGTNSVVTVNNSVLTCDQAPVSNVENYAVIMVNSDNSTVTVNGGEIVADAGNLGGAVDADGSAIVFNGTNGNCTIENHPYVISYGDNKYSMATWEEAYETAKDGETIELLQNVALSNPLLVSKNIAVDLNGHTLTAPVFAESNGAVLEGDSDSYVFWVKEGATLTINGEGTVAAQNAKYSIAVWAQGGNVVINGGTYTNAGEGADLIYASAGGNVVINGGEFVACPKQAGVDGTLNAYSALNVKDADYRSGASDIVVYGGKFFQFNPADNVSEGAGTNFCAAGKTVEQDGDWYIVK